MSCAPGLPHQLVLNNLLALGNYLVTNPIGKVVPGPGAVFDKYNSVIPDLVFVTKTGGAPLLPRTALMLHRT